MLVQVAQCQTKYKRERTERKLHRSRDSKRTRMKRFAVLILVFCHGLCEVQVNDRNDRFCQCSGFNSCCELGAMGGKVANVEEKITLLEASLQNTEKQVLELRSLIGGTPQVAFSAALRDSGSGDIGPFTTGTPLKYKRIFSNTGNGYNPSTGSIFMAMVKGMYFFRFSMFNNLTPTPSSVVSLMRNGVLLTSVWDTSGSDANDMGSNAVVIALDVGDN
ncbi:hypothetical protein L3Q82_013955, partial [Scortum barcoo]